MTIIRTAVPTTGRIARATDSLRRLLWRPMVEESGVWSFDLVLPIEEGVTSTDRPFHLVRVDIVAIAGHDSATFGEEPLRDAGIPKLVRDVHGVPVPKHGIDFIDVLAVLYELLHSFEVPSDKRAPPSML